MNAKQELLAKLKEIIGEHLGVELDEINERSAWAQLGADSLDRLEMSLAIEDTFKVDIPHLVGERLNTVGETLNHLLTLTAVQRELPNVQIEVAATREQWAQMSKIRTEVFALEHGFSVPPLPGPAETGVWHFLARDNRDAVGTLSVVDTTHDSETHQRYQLSFAEDDRVARYAQLAILKPYRQRGIFNMLIEFARSAVIRPEGFAFGWLLYPAGREHSSMLTQKLGFVAASSLLATEFGNCHVLLRRESTLRQVGWTKAPQRLAAAGWASA